MFWMPFDLDWMLHQQRSWTPWLRKARGRDSRQGRRQWPETGRHSSHPVACCANRIADMEVSKKWGIPIAGWFLLGKIPSKIRMITGGSPISGPPHTSRHVPRSNLGNYMVIHGAWSSIPEESIGDHAPIGL